jgi:hypothetical protein
MYPKNKDKDRRDMNLVDMAVTLRYNILVSKNAWPKKLSIWKTVAT